MSRKQRTAPRSGTPDGGRTGPVPAQLRAEVAELEGHVAMAHGNEAEWRQLIETMPQIVWTTRPDGWHTHFNHKWMEFTGLTLEQSLGFGWNPPLHPADRERAARRWEQATSSGQPYEIEYRLRRADGTYHWMLGRAMPLRDQQGRIVKWFGTCTDIEELKAAQSQLASQARLLDLTQDAIVVHDLEHRILHWNQGAARIHGWSAGEAIGRHLGELVATDTAQVTAAMRALLHDGEWRGELSGADRSGGVLILECRWSLLHDDDGKPHAVLAVNTDVTERRQAEAALEQSRSLQRMAGEVARLGGWSIDVARQEVVWSEELYDILSYPRQAQPQLREALSRYSSPDDGRVEQALEQCAATGVPFDLEAQIETYDARQIWVRVIGGPRYGPHGTITHIDGAFQDIDQLKASTRQAKELGERLTRTLESITDAFWTIDGDWRMTYINRRAEQLLCRGRGELLGVDLWESFPEAVGSVLDEVYHRVMDTGVSEVIEGFHWHPLDVWLDIHVYASERGLAVYFRDVSDQRKTRLELRERDARIAEQAALLDKARDAIIVRDLDHRVTYWNHSAERLYGYSAKEALGHPLCQLIGGQDDDQFARANATLLEYDAWLGELHHVARDGTDVVTETHLTLVRNDEGQPTSVLSIESDVTGRRRLEQQLLRTQRLESLGTLSGGIAHDLNNVLAPILMATQTIQFMQPEQRVAEMLSIIEQSARRGTDMVGRVLSFARGVDGKQQEVDLNEIVNQTTAILGETFPSTIELHREDPGDLPMVIGDPTQLHQVLMNLCINARDAMPDGGDLRIGLDIATVTDDAIAHECPPGRYLTVRIEDTGVGMDPQTLERAFEPFYTTKPEGQGTGLGLSTTHGIVRSHGGFIQLFSQPGAGTTFVLHLPLAPGSASPVAPVSSDELACGGGLLLLIEDEDNLRKMARSTLETHGYRVIDAANGHEALQLFDEHAEEIAAVITDMTMPNMDGPTTIRHLLARAPTIPILAISGRATGREATQSAALGITHVLAKPFSRDDLLAAVAQLLPTGPPTATHK